MLHGCLAGEKTGSPPGAGALVKGLSAPHDLTFQREPYFISHSEGSLYHDRLKVTWESQLRFPPSQSRITVSPSC